MPLDPRLVGQTSKSFTQDVNARWTMAHAAGLGDASVRYFDTTASEPVMAHPLFPVCLEWRVHLDAPSPDLVALEPDEFGRGVHATHDLHIHRPIRAGDRLTTAATIVSIEQRKAGAYQVIRFDTVDEEGQPVCTSYSGALLREVELAGEERSIETVPGIPKIEGTLDVAPCRDIVVAAGTAHIYSECAGIWNPNHTDLAVARHAGLPDIILHGTATLALTVSALVDQELGGEPARVRRVSCGFGAMVLMPSTLTLKVTGRDSNQLGFQVLTADGSRAIRHGYLAWD